MKVTVPLCFALILSGCASFPFAQKPAEATRPEAPAGADLTQQTRPKARPGELDVSATVAPERKPPAGARTVEQFDTTTPEEREAAAVAPVETGGEKFLGETVASLGDPTKPGFWLETPLVSSPKQGRVMYTGSGKSAQVDLIPIEGPDTAGSRISLAAMRLIEAPLTDLPTIEVYSND
ncbi:hypothetical protein J7443_04265 [Tropicibacter sp. R15_0]|uniref:hypothetical protein n=1 Tax=Tropicibacter sp. R15_0 TaxID=2821101 RepID=UPI001ADD2893|nr:hypothetical protein [Tropicibacter sp. R15_0]MBO9464436.1 hypothetical protein [Tropicibacter sp. R15_0]